MSKKTIVIIVVVVVAAYLIWRRRGSNATSDTSGGTSNTATGPDKNNLEDVINVAFANDAYRDIFAEKARKVYRQNTADMTTQAAYQEKAEGKNFTFAQMAVVDGAYLECYKKQPDGTWLKKDDPHEAYFRKVVDRVRAM